MTNDINCDLKYKNISLEIGRFIFELSDGMNDIFLKNRYSCIR